MTARDLFSEGDRLGDYEIRGRLRAGGMATLFLAQRHGAAGVTRPVAIKVIHPHLAQDQTIVRMFIDEARISSHIRHSNVVYIEEFGAHEGVYYIAMEYVDGCSLYEVLRACRAEGQKLSVALAVHLAIEVAAGLHAAHETTGQDGGPLGVVHRDISPSNVLLTRDGRVKVIDFGIAKARGRLGATHSGSGLKGKLRYMAPEQAWGQPIDRRTDVYALGVCLWELLTSRQLFRAKDDLAVLELVRNPVVAPPSKLNLEVNPALDAIVLRATAKRPEDRHQTALELRRDLMAAVPGAVAVPPELVAQLVHHVSSPDRAAITEQDESTGDVTEPSSAAPGSASDAAAGEVRPHAWRNRGLVFGGILGACATAIVITVAASAGDADRTTAQPAARTLDAGVAVVPTTDANTAKVVEQVAPAEPKIAVEPVLDAGPAEITPATPVVETPVAREPIKAPSRRPVRPAPHTDEGRVTAVEAGGSVLANEPTSHTTRSPRPSKAEPDPANAVRAGSAVLSK